MSYYYVIQMDDSTFYYPNTIKQSRVKEYGDSVQII